MDIIQQIIDFIKKLLGLADTAQALTDSSSAAPAAAAAPAASSSGPEDADTEEEDVADESTADSVRREFAELQAWCAKQEAEGLDLLGLDASDAVGFWALNFAVEQSMADGSSRADAAVANGFSSGDHYEKVVQYFNGTWSRLETDEDGDLSIRHLPDFTNAAMKARMGQMQAAQAAAAAADPNLLAPVGGVTVDAWASASAALAKLPQGSGDAEVAAALGQFGLDKASYDQANAGWQAKMQGDTTGAIATKFGEAFTASQGVSAGGAAPCTFEQWCEVLAAHECWSAQGVDIGAMTKSTFGIDLADFGAWSGYWSPKMATDVEMALKQPDIVASFKPKYAAADPDADLDL